MKFASNCFSGECGLCRNCCQNTQVGINTPLDVDPLQKGADLSLFMGRKYVQEITDIYNKNLIRWSKKYGYKDPFCNGCAPQTISLEGTYGSESFAIIDHRHSEVCDNPYCKMIYVSATSWEHSSKYQILPIYVSKSDRALKLCGPCMTNESFHKY